MHKLMVIVFLMGALHPLSVAAGQSAHDQVAFVEYDEELEGRIDRALNWLAKRQQSDGSYVNDIGHRLGDNYNVTGRDGHVGVTSIVGMAFMAAGHLPQRSPYGYVVEGCLGFVVKQMKSNGYITTSGSRMYSHAFATLFLSEVYGMTGRKELRSVLESAVELIVNNQNNQGGWRYNPQSQDSDLSVVVCLVQALRGAHNAGISVPKSVVDRAIHYVRYNHMSYKKPGTVGFLSHSQMTSKGGFEYQQKGEDASERVTFAITAAGVTALNGAGYYSGVEVEEALQFLERIMFYDDQGSHRSLFRTKAISDGVWTPDMNLKDHTGRLRYGHHMVNFQYFYGHYYAVQAMYQAGGERWKRWWSKLKDNITSLQKDDGHWEDKVGPHYATAMATLILCIPMRYLPIFQR